jgi:hypothetical protein
MLQDREFPWARVRLWALFAEVARAAGDLDEAARADTHLDELLAASA